MAQTFFRRLDQALQLMSQNKLRKDLDDTLLEKLLTFLKKCISQPSLLFDSSTISVEFDFMEELLKNTSAIQLINNIIVSFAEEDGESFFIGIKTFSLRLLGLILENEKEIFPLDNFFNYPIFKDRVNGTKIYHVPSIQDALINCLCCITKHLRGALWFANNHLEDFVFSNFSSTSYYVRKSAINFFISFIMQWGSMNALELAAKNLEAQQLEVYIKRSIIHIVKNLHCFEDKKQIHFSECCIFVTKQLLEMENFEDLSGVKFENLAKDIARCLIQLPEDNDCHNKMLDLFLLVHHKSKQTDEFMTDVIMTFLIEEDIKISFNLISSFTNTEWSKSYSLKEITIFMLPLQILTNTLKSHDSFFQVNFQLIHEKFVKKMENKSDCKFLVTLSLCALRNLVPLLDSWQKKDLALEILKVVKSDIPCHKWLYSVLQDRSIHHSLLDLLSTFTTLDGHQTFIDQDSDLIFKIIYELLKSPSSDSNFLSQLILHMKNLLAVHEKMGFILNDADKEDFIEILCRMLLDNKETIVDSAIQLTGQILCDKDWSSWSEKIERYKVHIIIWDIAIQGYHDGSVKSTALKVIVAGCHQEWFLNAIKSVKEVKEIDMVKILFDLTHDPDFFLQREALSSLFGWMKSKWSNLPQSSEDYFFSALVNAVKSLDLELKLISLDAWLWIVDNKFIYSDSDDLMEYLNFLTNSGFGLSLIFGIEDYDEAVKYKAAGILYKLRNKFVTSNISENSICTKRLEEPVKCHVELEHIESFTQENRDEGIDTVMEMSTAEQIKSICRQLSLNDTYDFQKNYFSVGSKDRKCTVSILWSHIWSENVITIVHPDKPNIKLEIESLLNDIIASKAIDFKLMEDTPDCY